MPKRAVKPEIHNAEGLAAAYEGVLANYSVVHSADDAIETKVAAFVAASLVIITLALTNPSNVSCLGIIGLAILGFGILASIYVLWSRDYDRPTVEVKDNLDYLDMENEQLITQLIADAENSLKKSSGILSKKNKAYPLVLWCFIIGAVLVIISLF